MTLTLRESGDSRDLDESQLLAMALATSNAKFRRRWARMEELLRDEGRDVEDCSTEELNGLWERAKGEER